MIAGGLVLALTAQRPVAEINEMVGNGTALVDAMVNATVAKTRSYRQYSDGEIKWVWSLLADNRLWQVFCCPMRKPSRFVQWAKNQIESIAYSRIVYGAFACACLIGNLIFVLIPTKNVTNSIAARFGRTRVSFGDQMSESTATKSGTKDKKANCHFRWVRVKGTLYLQSSECVGGMQHQKTSPLSKNFVRVRYRRFPYQRFSGWVIFHHSML